MPAQYALRPSDRRTLEEQYTPEEPVVSAMDVFVLSLGSTMLVGLAAAAYFTYREQQESFPKTIYQAPAGFDVPTERMSGPPQGMSFARGASSPRTLRSPGLSAVELPFSPSLIPSVPR